jgi:phosphopantetheinyl transferase
LNKQVFWSLTDKTKFDLKTSFLSKAEQAVYDGFRFDLRRNSFLAGRWVAKGLIQQAVSLDCSYGEISILNESSGKPYALVEGELLESVISISHAGKWAAAALSVDGLRVGMDVEVVTPRQGSFVADYFTSREFEILEDQSENYDRNVTLIWSVKEATLKALGLGLRLDTRKVWVDSLDLPQERNSVGWNRLSLGAIEGVWDGYWRQIEEAVLVCVADSQIGSEVELVRV